MKKISVSPTQREHTVPTGLPAVIDISNEDGPSSLAPVPTVMVPVTPPPAYKA